MKRKKARVTLEPPKPVIRAVKKTPESTAPKNSQAKNNREKKAQLQKILSEKVAQLESALTKERLVKILRPSIHLIESNVPFCNQYHI